MTRELIVAPSKMRAARLLAQLSEEAGEKVDDAVRAIAAAKSSVERDGADGVRSASLSRRASSPDAEVRAQVVREVADGPDTEEVVTRLREFASDSDPYVRAQAARALASKQEDGSLEVLLRLASDPEAQVRSSAARALANNHKERVTSVLLGLLSDESASVRAEAVRALADRRAESVTLGLLSLSGDWDSYVRSEAARALADRPGDRVTSTLLTLTTDRDAFVRSEATKALSEWPSGRTGGDDAHEPGGAADVYGVDEGVLGGYSLAVAANAVGLTPRVVDYWTRTGLIHPSLKSLRRDARLYSERELVLLKVVKRLIDAGVSLVQIRAAVDGLEHEDLADLEKATLLSDGEHVTLSTSDAEIVELLRDGRAVFGIAVGGVAYDIHRLLPSLPVERGVRADDMQSTDDDVGPREHWVG